jgi:hypothetical protein
MTKRAPLTLLTIFIVLSNIDAQDLYRNGFIITMNNDTLRGMINDTETSHNPTWIEFKENESASPKKYSWSEIKGFATSRGVYFESRHFQYDGDEMPTVGSELLPAGYFVSRLPEKLTDSDAFLEVLVKGHFSLFKYHDISNRVHYFILDTDKTELEELLHRRYKLPGTTTLSVNESYKQQLAIRCEKCPNLKSRITNLPYREKNLIKMISSMNECYGNQGTIPTINPEGKDRLRAKFGIVAEAYVTDPAFIHTTGGYDAIQFAGGISYEVFSPKRPNRLSFYSELKFKNFSNEDTYRAKFTSFTQTGKLTYQTVKLTNMARVYTGKISSLFFNIGVVYGMRFNTKIDGTAITDRDAKSIGISIEPRFELNVPNGQKSFALIIGKQF